MKSDVVFGLSNASWPVLLVEETGIIQNANEKAAAALGLRLANPLTTLGSIWLTETKPSDFLARCETSGPTWVRLKGADGTPLSFQAWVTGFTEEGKKTFLLQLHAEKVNAAPAQSDVVLELSNASWPVLLVEETGIIQNANEKAAAA